MLLTVQMLMLQVPLNLLPWVRHSSKACWQLRGPFAGGPVSIKLNLPDASITETARAEKLSWPSFLGCVLLGWQLSPPSLWLVPPPLPRTPQHSLMTLLVSHPLGWIPLSLQCLVQRHFANAACRPTAVPDPLLANALQALFPENQPLRRDNPSK
jgi:hypothetical protein